MQAIARLHKSDARRSRGLLRLGSLCVCAALPILSVASPSGPLRLPPVLRGMPPPKTGKNRLVANGTAVIRFLTVSAT